MIAPPMTAEAEPATCAGEVTRVLVVDDHPAVHLGLAVLMATAPGVELVATAATGQEGVRKFVEDAPHVVILDLAMPGQTGLVTLRQMLDHDPEALVLVLTASTDTRDVAESIASGAAGYLLKDTEGAELIAAIRAVRRGEVPVDARLTPALERTPDAAPRVLLTPREHDVLRLLSEGLSNQQIGVRLGIHQTTVKFHLRNAIDQIGVIDSNCRSRLGAPAPGRRPDPVAGPARAAGCCRLPCRWNLQLPERRTWPNPLKSPCPTSPSAVRSTPTGSRTPPTSAWRTGPCSSTRVRR